MKAVKEHKKAATPAQERWWICTGALANGGAKALGPFGTQELALAVRGYVEKVNAPLTYWVDSED